MELVDQIRALATRIAATKDLVQTEEATKTAMVMPFIQALGYNVFDPTEVTPELCADIGTKKGEKVDYAILKGGKPIILIECKKAGGDLNINHAGQLFRYFHVTAARFGVLTNGLVYQFFTDLERPNKMDEKPFFEFDILDFKDRDIDELKKFAKAMFDVDTILTTANELKITHAIQTRLSDWITSPAEDFVRLLAADILAGKRFTPVIRDQFTAITRRAFEQLIGERINERLKGAMTSETSPQIYLKATPVESAATASSDLATTPEEIEGFHIVRAILRPLISSKRVVMRDAQSYCAILLDDNNRKPICRLRFNNTERKFIGLFNANKEEERVSITHLDDLYEFADQLKATVQAQLGSDPVPASSLGIESEPLR